MKDSVYCRGPAGKRDRPTENRAVPLPTTSSENKSGAPGSRVAVPTIWPIIVNDVKNPRSDGPSDGGGGITNGSAVRVRMLPFKNA